MPDLTIFSDVPGIHAGIAPDARQVEHSVLLPVQTHTCRVAVVPDTTDLSDTDGIITLQRGLRIGVRTADCVPVLLYAPDIRAVAAVHAGWKGTLGGITTEAIEKMKSLGAAPDKIQVAFGPSICGDCYEVSPELADTFRAAGFTDCIIGTRNVDLEAVNRTRLIQAGLHPSNIRPRPCCTFETPALPSWRRQPTPQRLVTWIELL